MTQGIKARAREAFADAPFDFTSVLKVMTERMEAHDWWKKRVDGTPLANDLPVIATKAFFEMLHGEQ